MRKLQKTDLITRLAEAEKKASYYKRLSAENGKIRLRETEKLSELIQELKQFQIALQASQRHLKEIIDFLPDATFVINREGTVLFWNRAIEALTGVKAQEIIGKGKHEYAVPFYGTRRPMLIDLVLTNDKTSLSGVYEDVKKYGHVFSGEIFAPHIHGDKGAYLSATASRLFNESGEVIGAIESIRDITDTKTTEKALQQSEARYRSIFENTGTCMVIVDEDMTLSYVNAEFEKLTGFDRNKIIGNRKWMEFVHKEDMEWMVEQHKLRRIDKDLAKRSYEFRLVHKDGDIRNVFLTADVIPWTQQSVASLVDITELRKAEKRQKDLEERLQRSEKMEALGLLAGGVAHDINNVLGVLLGYSELILLHLDESSPLNPYVMKIMTAGKRTAAIIDDMLTLARRGVQTREVVNLNDLVEEFLKSPEFERIMAYHPRVRIKTKLAPATPNALGSPHQLIKTIMNLVSNAAEAMREGGGLTITTDHVYLDRPVDGYDTISKGDYIVIRVSDTGEGIPDHDLNRIFEPFYTKKVMGRSGTGLGLSVVWGTVKDHSGYIDVVSKKGKGSTFSLYFPATNERRDDTNIPLSLQDYMGKGEAILVVDDVPDQRELTARMLAKLNYCVATVSNGEEACDFLRHNRTDLVVLDMIMYSGMDGLDTYQEILQIRPRQKAILVSGFSETDRVQKAQDMGAGTFVKKPYELERIGVAVRRELERA